MATKDQVLKLLAKGKTPREIANALGCLPEYARAVRAREFGNGREVEKRYRERPEVRAYRTKYQRKYWASNPDYRERKKQQMRDRYHAQRNERLIRGRMALATLAHWGTKTPTDSNQLGSSKRMTNRNFHG